MRILYKPTLSQWRYWIAIACVTFLFQPEAVFAQNSPVIKVDLNKSGRQASEVNEPGYTSWYLAVDGAKSDSMTISGVKIKFTQVDEFGTGLTTQWYKAGISSPYYARLVDDGVMVAGTNANNGAKIEMRISGLPAGEHTLLTFHNTFDSPLAYTFSPINIYVNGVLTVEKLMPSNRALKTSDVPTKYFKIQAVDGQDVVVLFEADRTSSATQKNVTLCGFEINTTNIAAAAKNPVPADRDEHVDADNGTETLLWSPAPGVTQHQVYFGNDSASVANATVTSPLYKGIQSDTTYTLLNLYSMNTCYWRVDEITSVGLVTKGNVWYFRPRQLAFPDAEGYGRFARGGRGGKVVEVTNLNDDGPGSLRAAVTTDIGPRTIVFSVSGIIQLQSRLTLTQPYITVAGQTAPGKGICIRSAPFGMSGAKDAVIRDIRVRLGKGQTYDGMGMAGSDHCIIDHCSISWTIDEAFSSRNGKNITLQRTLISEALNVAGHQNYPVGTAHGYAASISGEKGSFHHNLLAHCSGRNWSLAGGLDGNGYYAGSLDIFNNIVYNWDNRTTDGGAHEVNFVNNYYKPGPECSMKYALNAQYDAFPGTQKYYFAGNVMPGVFDETNQTAGRKYSGTPDGYSPWVDAPFFPSFAKIHSATDAYKSVLSDVGCTQPLFDDHDIRIINETFNGTYTYKGSYTGYKGLIDDEADAGGYENYPQETRPAGFDSDHDGLPDWWENIIGTNANSVAGDFSDANADADHDGYTNLDTYLEWMANPHFTAVQNQPLQIDLSAFTRGYSGTLTFTTSDVANGVVTVNSSAKTAQFTPAQTGLAKFKFTVTDAAGATTTRTIGLRVESSASAVEKVQTNALLRVYPNPVKESLNLSYNAEVTDKAEIILINQAGAVALHKQCNAINGQNKVSLNVSGLASGSYLLTVKTGQTTSTVKVIKQ
ncbi:T9SS type A sorting domain-containing protein [Parabacteroides sp. FAFU027]|uniref:T9SS type A sorting domain-containing protein n=1 Tax=Parabacteroides sp. FAFU027 TaxID=2922715 RepID=UPI001FAFEF0B|nr:T9SS type A sorting domain-containing protein [Parabacteroides sp. FAFU027]